MTSIDVVAPNGRKSVTTGSQGTPGVAAYHTIRPLYSAAGIAGAAAIPSETTFFGYKRGDNVPGTGNGSGFASTGFHTNMLVSGQLPRPELFTVYGLRLYMPQIAFSAASVPALSDPGFLAAATADNDLLEDLLLINNSCFFQFEVGEKLYVNHPMDLLPSNIGYGGVAAISQDNGTATTSASLDLALVSTMGVGWNLWPFVALDGVRGPILIAEQQGFRARLRCQWGTNPSPNDHRIIFCLLDGQHTRAAQ